ncbi:MAG TPA: site-2 protease family protein [bacterium]|nr:site-2 protease family protein [bacterium]
MFELPDLAAVLPRLALLLPVILGSLVLHEMAHGYAALRLGDPTAQRLGRLSLNPIRHLDPVGLTVFLACFTFLGVGFGWAKPVPIDPRNLKNPKRDMAVIAAAGPAINFTLALLCVGYLAALHFAGIPVGQALGTLLRLEDLAAPLTRAELLVLPGMVGITVNLVLGLGNLIPIPPLDGSRILYACLPYYWGFRYYQLQRFTLPGLVALPAAALLLVLYTRIAS